MPRTRQMVRRSFGRSPGRLTEWFGSAFLTDISPLAASSFVVQLTMVAAELAKRPFTITRTIGELVVQSDQNAAVENPFGAFGGLVVSDKAVATGATAIPDPVSEPSSDSWFVYQPWSAEGAASTNVGRPLQRYLIDSRAQRKVQDGDQFVFVMANASAADGVLFSISLRVLVKLS